MHDIIALRQYLNKIILFCNCYYRGYHTLEYFSSTNPEIKRTINLDNALITVENLNKDTYVFRCLGANGYATPLTIDILYETKNEYFDKVLNGIDEKSQILLDNLKTDSWLPEIYKNFLNNKNTDYTNTYLDIIDKLIDNQNNMMDYMNLSDGLNTKLSNKHILNINLGDQNYFNSNDYILVNKVSYEPEYIENNNIYGFEEAILNIPIEDPLNININLDEGLYYISIYKRNSLVRSYWIRIKSAAEKAEAFDTELDNIQKIETLKTDSMYYLSSEYQFESEEEQEIISTLEYATAKYYMLPRPNLEYRDNILTLDSSDNISFFETIPKKIYLCGLEADSVYIGSTPHKLLISNAIEYYNVRAHFFNNERYYFNIQDEDGNVLSATTTLDLTNSNEPEEAVDYNDKYERIQWNKYVKNLYSLLGSNDNWGAIKTHLDRYLLSNNIGFENIKKYLEEQLLSTLSYKYNKLADIIYSIEFCDLKYRLPKDRSYMKNQLYKRLYNSHVIPAGDYILEITRINGTQISKEYKYQPDEALEIKVSDDMIILLRCIRLSDMKISDFVMYNNSGFGVPFRYNSLEVEIQNGL